LSFPDIHFNIDGILYTLPRESYVLVEGSVCALKLMSTASMNVWILGLNFFENYYTIFDQENRRVGFAPSIHAVSRMSNLSLVEEVPERAPDYKVIGLCATIMIIFLGVSCYFKRRNKSNEFTAIERKSSNVMN
jgi:hypothetical protein